MYGLSRKFGKAPRKKPPVETNIPGETFPRPLAQSPQQKQKQQQETRDQNSLSHCPDYRHSSGATRSAKYEPKFAESSNYGLDDTLMAMASYSGHDMFLRAPDALDGLGDNFLFPDATHDPTLGAEPRSHGTVDPLDLTFASASLSSPSDFQGFAEWIQPDILLHVPESQAHDRCNTPSSLPAHQPLTSVSSLGLHSTCELPDTSLLRTELHSCHTLAHATLESLSFRQDSIVDGEHLMQSMDQILSRNKQAVGSMHQLLLCPCSKSPDQAMLYASITSKILMRYQLVAGCSRPTTSWDCFSSLGSQPTPPLSASSSPSTTFVTPTSPMAAQNSFIVTPMQFSVGAFSVDDESAQEVMRKQLLLCELKKAGNLIDLLSVQGRDGLSSVEVNEVYSALGTWLKSELNRTIASLES